MKKLIKILLVSSENYNESFLVGKLAGFGEIIRVNSGSTGKKRLSAGLGFGGVIAASCVSGQQPTTLPFIRMARKISPKGQIFGLSGVPGFREKMKKAGCNITGDLKSMPGRIKAAFNRKNKKIRKG